MTGPRLLIDSPAGHEPLPYGLLSVVQTPNVQSGHWQNGVTYATNCPVTGGSFTTYDECIAVTGVGGGQPPAPAAKADNIAYPGLRAATPFTTYVEFDCAQIGFDGEQEMRRVATDALERVEPWQVERAVWTGQAGGQAIVHPHLASNTEVVLTETVPVLLDAAAVVVTGSGGVGVRMTVALGLLEQSLAECSGGRGVIHIARHAFPVLAGAFAGLIQEEAGRLRTAAGNLLAVGTGYTGGSPAGAARTSPGQTWIYGTGPVFALRGAVQVLGGGGQLDRTENTRRMIAERTWLLGWECCHFAVLVDLTL